MAIYRSGPEAVVTLVKGLQTLALDLWERKRTLEGQQAQDSHNSSKPPGSDGLKKDPKKRKKKRKKGKRKPGGQKGHPGHTLKQVKDPDHTIRHEVSGCQECGRSLVEQDPNWVENRQVVDIPEPRMEVTEHQVEFKTCLCGCLNEAKAPEGVTGPVQYGSRVKDLGCYMSTYQLLPLARLSEFFGDVYGRPIGEATLLGFRAGCAENLKGFEEAIRTQLQGAVVAHFDETGFYIEQHRDWLHVASDEFRTLYGAHYGRGSEAMEAMGVLPVFQGRAIHDHLWAYFRYGCQHGLCNAHHLRQLIFVWEEHHQSWARSMEKLLRKIHRTVEGAKAKGRKALPPEKIKKFERSYRRLLRLGFAANPKPPPDPKAPKKRGRKPQSKPRNLLDRLKEHQAEVLAFMHDFRVPFTNNLAERDLRMMKVQQKISGTFRSRKGAEDFCRVRGYISTARKNGLPILKTLNLAINGNPWIPAPDG